MLTVCQLFHKYLPSSKHWEMSVKETEQASVLMILPLQENTTAVTMPGSSEG